MSLTKFCAPKLTASPKIPIVVRIGPIFMPNALSIIVTARRINIILITLENILNNVSTRLIDSAGNSLFFSILLLIANFAYPAKCLFCNLMGNRLKKEDDRASAKPIEGRL